MICSKRDSKAIVGIMRIKFHPGEQREFIEKLSLKSGYSTAMLAEIAGVHPRSFRDWKREKLTMTVNACDIFCKTFNLLLPENREKMIERWQIARKEANRKGGLSRFARHGSPGTPEGRSKGGIKSIANLKKNGIFPTVKVYNFPNFDTALAEYVGIMLGDGGITSGQCTITLNSEADRNYIYFVSDFAKQLFGENPKQFQHKGDKAITLYYNGVSLVKFLVFIGLRIGNKVKQQVDVPDWIKDSPNYRKACLRGLVDTDGGIFLHKYKVAGKEYIYKKMSFSNRSIPLLVFVRNTLQDLGFTPKVIDKVENKKVWLYNQSEVARYLCVVGTHNARLLKHETIYSTLESGPDGQGTGLLNLQGVES